MSGIFYVMQFQENVSLQSLHTFGTQVQARYLAHITQMHELQDILQSSVFQNNKRLFLGGGSNILFTQDFDGLVIKLDLQGREVIKENETHIWVKAMAGEDWDDFVAYCVDHNWGGIENLSLIPGNVGTSPIQNIGAYGIEIKDSFYQLEALNLSTGLSEVFKRDACQFGYRSSYFKHAGKDQYVITSVSFQLSKINHDFRTHYGAIQQELAQMGSTGQSLKDIRQAIIQIRNSKLPDPKVIGNAGSFFKNPVVSDETWRQLQLHHPDIVAYEQADGQKKLAAGWLIEKAGWKGFRDADAGVHPAQALVLVNYGTATGAQILRLAHTIQASVREKFGVIIEPEVNIF